MAVEMPNTRVLAEAGEWSAGLTMLTKAFSSLPSSAHQPLWEQKVRFMCKAGGKGLMGEMFRLKDFPAETQARVWSVMGANADGKGEQLTANMRAVEALASGEPLQKVDYLITLAEWLYCRTEAGAALHAPVWLKRLLVCDVLTSLSMVGVGIVCFGPLRTLSWISPSFLAFLWGRRAKARRQYRAYAVWHGAWHLLSALSIWEIVLNPRPLPLLAAAVPVEALPGARGAGAAPDAMDAE